MSRLRHAGKAPVSHRWLRPLVLGLTILFCAAVWVAVATLLG
jgi:hypothetical protein